MKADKPVHEGGKQYHLETSPGDLAAHCLLVGSPERAEMIAKTMFRMSRKVGDHRGLKSFTGQFGGTGSFGGVPVSVVTTGMGSASTAIVLPEAVRSGARRFIRVGSGGALWKEPKLGESMICTGAVRLDGASENWAPIEYPALADYRVVAALVASAQELGLPHYVGIGATTTCFNEGQARPDDSGYVPPRLKAQHDELVRRGVLFYSMEEATLFVWCTTHGGYWAGAVDAVYAQRQTNEFAAIGDEAAAQIALHALAKLAKEYPLQAKEKEMSEKLSPEAQEAYETIQRCVAAVPLKPLSTSLEDFPGSVMMPVRPKKRSSLRKSKRQAYRRLPPKILNPKQPTRRTPMSQAQNLDVAELKSLFLANFRVIQAEKVGLRARIQQELGGTTQEEKPEVVTIMNKIIEQSSEVIACRLKDNRRDEPLVSSRDFVQLVSPFIDAIALAEGCEFGNEERQQLEKFLKAVFEGVTEMAQSIVAPGKNPYDENWRWVETVLNLAAMHDIVPTKLFELQWARDEITRQMFTREQFVAHSEKGMSKFVDADALKQVYLQPMIDLFAKGDEEERRELEQKLEAKVMPQLRENVARTKPVINAWLNEQVARIYGAA